MIANIEPTAGKARIRKAASQVPVPQTRAQMEALVGQIATLKRDEAAQKLRMDRTIAKVKADFEESLARVADEMKPLVAAAETWATSNPAEFGKAKSIRFLHGTVGFRTGTPKLKLLSKWTWDKVLEAAMQYLPNFIRSKPELDKEAILGQRDELADLLPLIGVKVVQD